LEAAKSAFSVFEDQIRLCELRAKDAEIKTDADLAEVTEGAAAIKRLVKQIEDKRKEVIGPHDRFVRRVNAFVRGFRDKLTGIEKELKRKIGNYSYQQELKRREEEKRIKEALKKEQEALDAAADQAGVERVVLPDVAPVPEKRTTARTESGTASTRFELDFEVVEFDKVPRRYLTVNERAVKDAIKAGVRDIPGVRIFEKPVVSVRTN
ncbi:MAG: hypothetical protein JRJ54_15695, partial [Deltaproteobacteria bacterium]|nr:hypothetical protein [Deltaproteobacteria bacterium]